MALSVGDPAPLFSGTDVLTDAEFSLAEHEDKCVLIAFHGITWCAPCTFAYPLLQEVWEEYSSAGAGVQFVVVSVNEEVSAEMLPGITMPWLTDQSIVELYEANSPPKYFFLDQDLKITHIQHGLFSNNPVHQKNGIRQHIDACLPPSLSPGRYEVAIDPLALFLTNKAYVMLTLPDPPPLEVLSRRADRMVAGLDAEDRRRALAEVRKIKTYVEAIESAFDQEPSK
jgi:peroxiredoxin